jgi:tetrahydromethanopterin S-methyltransferase subunit E
MTDPSLDSHTMMVVGSILQIFSMFMLSLAHQESYYEVRVHGFPHLARAFYPGVSVGILGSGSGDGPWAIFVVPPILGRDRAPL